eukprot:8291553-Prorocentrum_lima.AAC.1
MTSSLVGSEMCIRDSPFPFLIVSRRAPRLLLGHSVRTPCSSQWREKTSAVSYTHLTLPTICSV